LVIWIRVDSRKEISQISNYQLQISAMGMPGIDNKTSF